MNTAPPETISDEQIMEIAGEWFHTGENQRRHDGYYYRSLGTPSNVRGSDLIAFARALLAARPEPQYRHAGWFREVPSAMSYRLWEQGGHAQGDGEVELFERVGDVSSEDARMLDWADANNASWCHDHDDYRSHLYYGTFADRKIIHAPTFRFAIRAAMAQEKKHD